MLVIMKAVFQASPNESRSLFTAFRKRLFIRYALIAGGVACFPFVPLYAVLEPLERSFTVQRWTADDGLPGNSVQDLGYGPDGLLWGASGAQLWHFDGSRFASATGAFPDYPGKGTMIKSFEAASEEGLYIQAGAEGNWLTQGRWQRIAAEKNGSGSITTFRAGGKVWNLTLFGLVCATGAKPVFYPMPENGSKEECRFTWASPEPSGSNVWVTASQGLFRFSEGRYIREALDDAGDEKKLEHVCVGASGQIWVYGHPDRFYVRREGRWESLPKPSGEWPERMGVEAMAERNGSELWVGTSSGLFRWDGRDWSRLEPGGLAPSGIISLLAGRSGEVWAGLEGGGLLCLRERRIAMVRAPGGPAIQPFAAVYESGDGTIFAGIANAGLWAGSLDRLEHRFVPRLYKKTTVLAIAEDVKGRLLIGPAGGSLLRCKDGSSEMIYPGTTAPWMDYGIRSLLADQPGWVWVGTQRGLMYATDGSDELVWVDQGQHAVNDLARTKDGTLWIASDRHGVMSLQTNAAGKFALPRQEGVPFADARTLCVDSCGRLWAGGAGGLAFRREDGVWHSVDAPGIGTVVQIIEDMSGKLWIGTLKGIACVVSLKNPVKLIWYGLGDGLDNEVCSGGFGNAGCRLRDGRLLLPTQNGLAVVDPLRVTASAGSVVPLLDEVLADGQIVWRGDPFERFSDGPFTLNVAAGTRTLTIRYLASDTQAGCGALFRCRMESSSVAWSPWTASREAVFQNLSPARYVFHLQAATRDGEEAEMTPGLYIRIQPFWWQRRSTQAAGTVILALAFGVGMWRLGRWRLHRRLDQLQRERTVEAERSRISRELHDDVGSSLTQIAMMSQSVKQFADSRNAENTALLEKIFLTARSVTRSLDEIVWSLNPKQDRLENMLVYFASHAREFLSAAHIRCRIHLPDADMDRTVPSTIRHHLYLAFKESLHNIVKHAQASEVWIRVSIDDHRLVLEISDDGKGVPSGCPAPVDADGMGNLVWRMAQVGGECRQGRSESGGFKTTLSVPVSG